MEEVEPKTEEENPQNVVILSGVPLFLHKLWDLVCNEDTNSIICWNSTGNAFIIKDQFKLSTDLLPVYFKHNNFTSFIRQLNLYGFHKLPNSRDTQFYHPYFRLSNPELLSCIKRKLPAPKSNVEKTVSPQHFEKVLEDVQKIKDKQENVEEQLSELHEENSALWYELCSLRTRHNKQTKLVNKLVHVLVNFLQHNEGNICNLNNNSRTDEKGGGATIVEVGNYGISANTQKMIEHNTNKVTKSKYPVISYVDPESRKRKLIEFLNEGDKNLQSSETLLNNLQSVNPNTSKKKIILKNNTVQPAKNKNVVVLKDTKKFPVTVNPNRAQPDRDASSNQSDIAVRIQSDPILSTFIKPTQQSISSSSKNSSLIDQQLVSNARTIESVPKPSEKIPVDSSADLDEILSFLVEPDVESYGLKSTNTEGLNSELHKNDNILEGISTVDNNIQAVDKINKQNDKITQESLGSHVENVQLDLDNLQFYLNELDFDYPEISDLFNDTNLEMYDKPSSEEDTSLKPIKPN